MKTKHELQKTSTSNKNINDDTNVETSSSYLDKYKITLVCGGGIAALEVPRFIRELRRFGAKTQVCMTENCLKFVGLEAMRWASQNEVILNPSGLSEHICQDDVIIVAPATADLISKIRHGICSDSATTFVQSAIGAKKIVLFCPTMHNSLADSPIVQQNIKDLKKLSNVFFIEPRKEEGKQKIPDVKTLALNVSHIVNKNTLKPNKHLLITYGGTRVMIDPVRCLTNLSTGALGAETTKLLYAMGFDLTILRANSNVQLPLLEGITIYDLPNYNDMFDFCCKLNPKKYDGLIHLVAGSDYEFNNFKNKKLSSKDDNLTLSFSTTKKLISQTKLNEIKFKCAAKLIAGINIEEGIKIAKDLMIENNLNGIFVSSADDAWGNNKSHYGIFLKKEDNKIFQTKVKSKKDISLCYFNLIQG